LASAKAKGVQLGGLRDHGRELKQVAVERAQALRIPNARNVATSTGKGRWYAVLDTRGAVTGERKRKWVSSQDCKGKRDAQTACSKLITEMKAGSYVEPFQAHPGAVLQALAEAYQAQRVAAHA
jgi:hypothetical protein